MRFFQTDEPPQILSRTCTESFLGGIFVESLSLGILSEGGVGRTKTWIAFHNAD